MRSRKLFVGFAAAAAVSLVAFPGPASAEVVTVTDFDDGIAGEFGIVDDDQCSLREAIQATNTDSNIGTDGGGPDCAHDGGNEADTINLSATTDIFTTYNIQSLDGTQFGDNDNHKGDFDIDAGAGLTIQGAGTGATRSAIKANGFDRVFHVLSASTGPVTINGVILTGRADNEVGGKGGGIWNEGGNLTVTGSLFDGNVAGAGANGIETNGTATTQITDSSFRNGNMCCDTTTTGGGAIGVSTGGGGSVTITNSEIGAPGEGNQVQSNGSPARGGGISFAPATNATLTVTDSRIVNNDVTTNGSVAQGGGVFIENPAGSGTVNFTRTLISGNDSSGLGGTDNGFGGGVYVAGSGATFTDSWIRQNNAFAFVGGTSEGGGIYNGSTSTVRVAGTTLSENNPRGVYNLGTAVLLNSTVVGNGGGIAQAGGSGSSSTIVNSTFSDNGAGSGNNVTQSAGTATVRGSILDGEDGCSGTITSGGFNLDSSTGCEDSFTHFTDIEEADTGLGALQDNGGPDAGGTTGGTAEPIPTREPAIDANPADDSDAIDRIDTASCTDDGGVTLLATDQRGIPRPFDGDSNNTEACDSGAVEVPVCFSTEATNLALIGTSAGETLTGTAGADVILGAGGNDTIDGGGGDDKLCGNAGNDTLNGNSSGPLNVDRYHGHTGVDEVTFEDATTGVIANLALGTVNGGAAGTISNGTVENLRGSEEADTLTGDSADNVLSGGDDNDTLDGQGHGGGGDTADFTGPSPIIASLQAGTATGDGADTLSNLENLRGGSAGDNLTGDGNVNVIAGGAGTDTITGLGGTDQLLGEASDDSIFARDGILDTVDCAGDAADSVEADAAGVDVIDPSCENVSFFVAPTTPPATTAPAETGERAAALKKCKKKKKKNGWSKKRYNKCKKQANQLPV